MHSNVSYCFTLSLCIKVNLPAHLVVIKSTLHYVGGGFQEYTESQILQMIGRAGRPQVSMKDQTKNEV